MWYAIYPKIGGTNFMSPTPILSIVTPTPVMGGVLNDPIVQHIITPIIQYAISPVIVFAIFLFILNKMYNFGALSQKIARAITDIDQLKNDGKKLLSHVDIIKTHLVDTTGLKAELFSAASPLKLLPKGLAILKASGFEKIYRDNKRWFIKEVKKDKPRTVADIDESSLKVLEECRGKGKFINFKELAFNNGITLDVLLKVLSIYLRDEVAKEILGREKLKRLS